MIIKLAIKAIHVHWFCRLYFFSTHIPACCYVAMCWCGGGFGSKMKACILMVLLLAVSCRAQLTRDEKQLILDLHNYYRATASAANMQRLVSKESRRMGQ